jgi:hypothetical protein
LVYVFSPVLVFWIGNPVSHTAKPIKRR